MFGHDEPKKDDNNADSANNDTLDDSTGKPTLVTPNPDESASPAFSTTPSGSKVGDKPSTPTPKSAGDLLGIKQDALKQLTPLIGHLDQSPEERFRTTMMMIQASDDQNLIKDAYEAAQKITDEKARAQALLDIINEINYFTQHNG